MNGLLRVKPLLVLGASLLMAAVIAVSLAGFTAPSTMQAHRQAVGNAGKSVKAKLDGFQQVPSLLTNGSGTFTATISQSSISYTLTYSGLSSQVTVAHIHFAQPGVNGGVIAFLCGGGGKAACPASGTVSGTITATDIIGPADQGIAAGDFAGAVRAIQSGNTYVNVHSTTYPMGEIRGQITD
jgi:CHRD domain